MKEKNKIHHVLVDSIALALSDIFVAGKYADKVIEFYLKKNRKWGARDRRFVAESIYEVVRWWRYLWWLKGEPSSQAPVELSSLKSLWAHWWYWKKGEQVSPYLNDADLLRFRERIKQKPLPAELESVPDWLFERGERELGESLWMETLIKLNEPALVYLRTNTLKTKVSDLIERLKAEGIEAHRAQASTSNRDLDPTQQALEALVLAERKNVFATQAFKEGLFEVQDLSSQHVAPFLNISPGMRVIDACAGAGGKTLHLASLLKNKGKIIALDIHEWKLKELRTRASRNGIDVIETKLIEGQKTIKRLAATADRLLLDVPCSGVGVLRRNPDSKWKLQPAEFERLAQLQKEILSSYSRMVKPGGKLVYSTCSIFPSENEQQVRHFLEGNKEFSLVKQKTFMPQDYNSDGFYMALIERNQ